MIGAPRPDSLSSYQQTCIVAHLRPVLLLLLLPHVMNKAKTGAAGFHPGVVEII